MSRSRKPRRRKRRSTKAPNKAGSIGAISLLSFVCFALILTAAIFLGQLEVIDTLEKRNNDVAKMTVQQTVYQIEQAVSFYTHALNILAKDPTLEPLLLSRNAKKIASKEAVLKTLLPGAMLVRILPAGYDQLDKTNTPHIGYACLDLIRKSKKNQAQSIMEAHVFGTPQQHIDIIQPLFSQTRGSVYGHIKLALKPELLNEWFQQSSDKVYLELRQTTNDNKSLLLSKLGNSRFMLGSAAQLSDVAGTRWNLTMWSPSQGYLAGLNIGVFSVLAVAILLAGLVIRYANRRLSMALKTDLHNFINLATSRARGVKIREYTLHMKEFKQAAQQVDELLDSQNPMERERDDDPNAISTDSLRRDAIGDIDPLFLTKDSMAVEELDSAAFHAQIKSGKSTGAAAKQGKDAPKPAPPVAQSMTSAIVPEVPPAEIFKAYDIRGIVGISLTAQHMTLIGRALGSEAVARGLKNIAFARDGRLSGPELGGALVKGLQSTGINVIDAGMVPTPVLYYTAIEAAQGTGAMLTGSHNPPDYNGLKIMLGGETLWGDSIQALHARIKNKDFTQGKGGYKTIAILDKYINRIVSDVKLNRQIKVVVDCGNGVAGMVAPKLLRELGCNVVELFCDVDGRFPNHHPDPGQPANLKDLIEAVKVQHADLGIAFDGDGDRLGVVSSDGIIIWPDRLLMLFAIDVLSRNHGAKIIYDVKCTSNLTKVIWEKGGEPLMWKTGHSLIKSKLKETKALLAGEMSGHVFFNERWYGFDDGLYSAARLFEILSNDTRKPDAVFAALPDAVNTPELQVKMAEGANFKLMDELMDRADFGSAGVTMIDGVRVDYEDGWGLVRASNTTPCLILRFEGKDQQTLQRIQEVFKKILLALDSNLALPF